jgi:uncharacterized protein (TIGR00266 family)
MTNTKSSFAESALENARRVIAEANGGSIEINSDVNSDVEAQKEELQEEPTSKKMTTAELIDAQMERKHNQNVPVIEITSTNEELPPQHVTPVIAEEYSPQELDIPVKLTPERKVTGKNYTIFNNQIVEITLEAKEDTVIAEPGAMCYMSSNIEFKTRTGDGSKEQEGVLSKMFTATKRTMLGESFMMCHFTNVDEQNAPGIVGFSYPFFGEVRALDLAETGNVTCQKKAFLCATKGVSLDITFSKKLSTGFFGGEGFTLQKLSGQGTAFIYAGGALVEKKLHGEKLMVDTGSIVGFSEGITFGVEAIGGIRNLAFGKEGLFLSTLSGHGTVWLQSAPFSRMAKMVIAEIPPEKNKKR